MLNVRCCFNFDDGFVSTSRRRFNVEIPTLFQHWNSDVVSMLMIDVVSTLKVRRCFNVVILTFASTLKVGRCFNVETLFNVEIPTLFQR